VSENNDTSLEVQVIVDSDEDGLSDEEEAALGTDPNNKDSDGDGIEDGVEVEQGRNPLVNEAVIILIINSAEN